MRHRTRRERRTPHARVYLDQTPAPCLRRGLRRYGAVAKASSGASPWHKGQEYGAVTGSSCSQGAGDPAPRRDRPGHVVEVAAEGHLAGRPCHPGGACATAWTLVIGMSASSFPLVRAVLLVRVAVDFFPARRSAVVGLPWGAVTRRGMSGRTSCFGGPPSSRTRRSTHRDIAACGASGSPAYTEGAADVRSAPVRLTLPLEISTGTTITSFPVAMCCSDELAHPPHCLGTHGRRRVVAHHVDPHVAEAGEGLHRVGHGTQVLHPRRVVLGRIGPVPHDEQGDVLRRRGERQRTVGEDARDLRRVVECLPRPEPGPSPWPLDARQCRWCIIVSSDFTPRRRGSGLLVVPAVARDEQRGPDDLRHALGLEARDGVPGSSPSSHRRHQ